MIDRVIVRRGAYHDSITLMLASRTASETDGARDVAVAMATPVNLDLIRARGFDLDLGAAGEATASDLVIAIRADDSAAAGRILAAVDSALSADAAAVTGSGARSPPASLRAAIRNRPDVSLAVLSVPGRYVAYEAALALEAGVNVFCFSDGVSLEEEKVLKRAASERGLMLMGPDCGTAIIDGVALGFANDVARGPVGIVGASGTGIQEVSCLLDLAGVGVSHAIGVGGRDLASEIGGSMTRRGLELLASDPGTEVIVVISKPPDAGVAAAVREQAATIGKPVILAFVGLEDAAGVGAVEHADGLERAAAVEHVDGLERAAARAAELLGRELPPFENPRLPRPATGHVRGLFSGGTLCTEAMAIMSAVISPIASNIPLKPDWRIGDLGRSDGHTFIDFGSDELTQGRPHPMIDPALRVRRLAREARDPTAGVILLDIVLGYGSHPDPAAEFAPVIADALAERDDVAVVVALIGTDRDPQGFADQRTRLEEAGALVTQSVAHASRLALATLEATP